MNNDSMNIIFDGSPLLESEEAYMDAYNELMNIETVVPQWGDTIGGE